MNAKKVLVTGATGLIGTKVVEKLLARGYSVRGMARREKPTYPRGCSTPPEKLWSHPNFEYFQGDVCDYDSVFNAMAGCDFVIHLAAYAKNWSKDKTIFARFNIDAMENVFRAAKAHNIERIVWTSTIVTLGPTRPGVCGDEEMERITDRYFTEYEETKSIAEKKAFEWVEKEHLPLVIVNPTRVFGPGQLSESNAVVDLIRQYCNGTFPILLNYGRNVGNYVLVDDVAEGHILALEKGRIGQKYILGSENYTLGEFFKTVGEEYGRKRFQLPIYKIIPLCVANLLKFMAETFGIYPKITPGWVKTFLADWEFSCDKAKRELGYDPVPVREGIRRSIEWLRELKEIR